MITEDDIIEKIQAVLIENSILTEEEINKDDFDIKKVKFSETNMDSLSTVEMIMKLEEEFGIEIPDDDAQELLTVMDIVEYIMKNKKE